MTERDEPVESRSKGRGALKRSSDKIQLLIVDEHPLVRAGVRTLLETDGNVEVVAEADNVDDAVTAMKDTPADVVLMDVDEATNEAVEDMRRLREEAPDPALVVLARSEDDEEIYRAVLGGASGHVGENAQPQELVDTIMEAAEGREPIRRTLARRPLVGRRVLEAYADLAARGPVHASDLTTRELNVLRLAAEGMTNQQIGRELGVSEHTVKSSISNILARLGLRHRTEAVVHALRNGWIAPPTPHVEPPPSGSANGRIPGHLR